MAYQDRIFLSNHQDERIRNDALREYAQPGDAYWLTDFGSMLVNFTSGQGIREEMGTLSFGTVIERDGRECLELNGKTAFGSTLYVYFDNQKVECYNPLQEEDEFYFLR